ncbi:FHA domain-containing protein PS1 [Quillaja saponaria]|uniref:FHA domain-containing protein PS1 n=1 Tax=Quillaja saponaria TaxID=32244 RepID=A0AAD7Q394_QUISA|nr:FHA domain-containing protein PS1 [Quillaja saponaria]
MADSRENRPDQEEEKIPVFTVLKNGAILKNIFILNKPPQPLSNSDPNSAGSVGETENTVQDYEEILVVGRHPDCNIMLTHPSISRFHLQIYSKPSSQKLSVIDLSSVHGTWVSERKLDPGMMVELTEGDTLRVGGSSRVYRLHWVPLSRAYDLESPFVSALDIQIAAQKEEKIVAPEEENAMENMQNESLYSIGNEEEIQSQGSILEGIDMLFVDENLELILKKEIPSAPLMREDVTSLSSDQKEDRIPSKGDHLDGANLRLSSGPLGAETVDLFLPVRELTLGSKNKQLHMENQVIVPCPVKELVSQSGNQHCSLRRPEQTPNLMENLQPLSLVEEEKEAYPEAGKPEESEILTTLREFATESSSFSVGVQEFKDVIRTPQDPLTSQSVPDRGNQENSFEENKSNLLVNLICSSSAERHEAFPAAKMPEETEFGSTSRENEEVRDVLIFGAGTLVVDNSLSAGEAIPETKIQQLENLQAPFASQSLPDRVTHGISREEEESNLPDYLNSESCEEQGHPIAETVQEIGLWSIPKEDHDSLNKVTHSVPLAAEPLTLTSPEEVLLKVTSQLENQTPQSFVAGEGQSETESSESHVNISEKKSSSCCIWSRRGKIASALEIQTGRSGVKKSTGNSVRVVEMNNSKATITKTTSKDLFSDLDGEEEEIFTPDKENFTPNTLLLRSMKKKGNLAEIEHPKLRRSYSSKITSPNIQTDQGNLTTSDKENQTPKVLKEQKPERTPSGKQVKLELDIMALSNREERAPFQSLLVNSSGNSRQKTSIPYSATRSSSSINQTQNLDQKITGEQKRNWAMVVDTSALLNKESRKSLKLLQGLKGTRLIIPRMVIRELDCMKQRGSLFRRTTEVSLVLEWIEECMVQTKWWIHVQSSAEDEKLIAPTPKGTSMLFSPHSSLMEIFSPTAEDHIVDCAILYEKKNNEQLVLLSNDVTLKIKAMAEGLLCETVEEFRESLVNPFSERFLWVDSSARGQTWSYLDDVVLKERYSSIPSKKSSKVEGARGLKLILLHNTHYGRISSVR